MQYITAVKGRLYSQAESSESARQRMVQTALPALNGLLAGRGFQAGAVHELIYDDRAPLSVAFLIAASVSDGVVVWSNPMGDAYPPAAWGMGISHERLRLLQPLAVKDHLWALAECLRCRAVAVTVAHLEKLSRIEARRLQLAAEAGGGLGIFLRSESAARGHYAAATRWRVQGIQGTEQVQRWSVALIHGHGGRTGESVIVEVKRDTRDVRAVRIVAARQAVSSEARATA